MGTSTADADIPPSPGPPEPGSTEAAARAAAQAPLGRLPPRLRRSVARLLSRWPGRIAFGALHIIVQSRIRYDGPTRD
jgi:hypothetical protein